MDAALETGGHEPVRSRGFVRSSPVGKAVSVLSVVAVVLVAVAAVDRSDPDTAALNSGAAAVDYGSDVDVSSIYDPFVAGEHIGDPGDVGYHQILPRDFIRPVYQPRFSAAAEIDWPEDADVIGISIDGEAKAYPISFLSGREMVLDELAGEPLLVSW